ncbi:MAG TPA: DUF2837 family protein [Desulfosporosinus sp.]|nr:DUF2837 family protein [Desulfosporosinus sp.]
MSNSSHNLYDGCISIINDQALSGKRPSNNVKVLVVLIITSKLVGTLHGSEKLFLCSIKYKP